MGLMDLDQIHTFLEIVRRIFEAWTAGDWSIGNEYLDPHAVCVVDDARGEPQHSVLDSLERGEVGGGSLVG